MFYAFKPDWTSGGPLDKCDQKLSTRWQRNLHSITEKSAEPQLYLDKIENLNVTYPDWPFAIARLGKAYLLLEDIHGALEQFEKALRLLSPLQDEKFARYVEGLRAYVKNLETEEDDEWANPPDGVIVSPWAPPKEIGHYSFSDASGASMIKSAWDRLLSEDSTGIMSSRYARLLCIETNEIEKVFALGGESLPRLVKVGFYTGAIDRVRAEGVQEPQKIVSILGDLQKCLNFLTNFIKNPSQLNEDTICQIHKIAVQSSRIGSHYDGENTIFYLTHPGVYRKRLITTSMAPEKIVQYTHQSMVPSEMNLFVGMMRSFLEEKDISPFAVAAWIHATFARIHPFTVSVLSPYFIKCTENLRMGMAVFPACLHHCHSFTLATLSSMSVHTSGRNTCRLYSKHKLRQIFSPSWMYLPLRCLTPLITYNPYLQLHQKMRSIEFQLILGSLVCLCKSSEHHTHQVIGEKTNSV